MRQRSVTIYAENQEEYLFQLDQKINSADNNQGDQLDQMGCELQEEDNDANSKLTIANGSGFTFDCSDEERFIDNIYSLSNRKQKYSQEEEETEFLCNYLKASISSLKENETDIVFFPKGKKLKKRMSNNAISDFELSQITGNAMSTIIYHNNDESYGNDDDSDDPNTDSKALIAEAEYNEENKSDVGINNVNERQSEHLKLMTITNSPLLKKNVLQRFIGDNKLYQSSSFEIRKKEIKLYDQRICIDIFDTEDLFHNYPTSNANCFLLIIDGNEDNCISFISKMKQKIASINGNSNSKPIAVIAYNLTIDNNYSSKGENIREFVEENEMIFLSLTLNQFTMTNPSVRNLISLFKIKKSGISISPLLIKTKANHKKNNKRDDHAYDNDNFNLKSTNLIDGDQNSLGFNTNYRIKLINALDFSDCNDNNKDLNLKRKLSLNILAN